MVNRCRQRAKLKGLMFDLTAAYIHSIFPTDNKCPVFGFTFRRGVNRQIDESPSIDRIDCQKGYTIGNVRVISAKANRIKNNGTVGDVTKVLKYMQACSISA